MAILGHRHSLKAQMWEPHEAELKDQLCCVLKGSPTFRLLVLQFPHLQNGAMPQGVRTPGIDTMERGGG